MVFVTHDERHEISDFFVNTPHKHTDNYFEIDKGMALRIENEFRHSEGNYIIYDRDTHQVKGVFSCREVSEQRYARLDYTELPQLILKATKNLEEAREDLKKIYQARKKLREKYLLIFQTRKNE